MCRLFASISENGNHAEQLLLDAPQSLIFQSRVDRKRAQKDGWGIGWFNRGKPVVFKSPKPMDHQAKLLRRVARQVRGRVLLAHVRWASNPLKLPKHELIGLRHTQPFSYHGWIFAHNGTLLIPREVLAELGPLAKEIRGNNDSEVLFYWLMKHLRGTTNAQIVAGVRKSLKNLDAIWHQCRRKYPLYKYPFHGLNWVLTNGKILIAQCYTNPGGFGKAKALIQRKEPYYQLRYKQTPEGWRVASEPLDLEPGWKPVPHGQLLITNGHQGRFYRCF